MGKTNIEDDDRYEFKGVKIAHELMVDILGALIPGALFLFCTIVCIVFPLICYATPNNNFGFLMKDGDWFWIVAFLSFLILSYVIGLIFYRSDIKVPDRRDIRREQDKKLTDLLKRMPTTKIEDAENYVAELLVQEISPLEQCLSKYKDEHIQLNSVYNEDFIKSCNECVKTLSDNSMDNATGDNTSCHYDSASVQKNILKILFPEWKFDDDSVSCSKTISEDENDLFPAVKNIPEAVNNVIKQTSTILPKVKRYIMNHIECEWNNQNLKKLKSLCRLIVSYMILHMQNESGCATEDRCDFPYMSYYKYLLKRELKDLLKYVKWYTPASRTKNQLNQYKIDLQLHVPNAFSIITKNESHIRMASSSWHVAKIVLGMSIITGFIMFVFVVLGTIYHVEKNDNFTQKEDTAKVVVVYQEGTNHTVKNIPTATSLADCNSTNTGSANIRSNYIKFIDSYMYYLSRTNLANEYLAFLFPVFIFLLAWYILRSVPKFIHYQRLREIYYTLSIYKLWDDAKAILDERYQQNLAIRRAEAGMPPESSESEVSNR